MIRWLAIVGVLLVSMGLVMIPLPGPGWLVVSVGAALLVVAGAARLLCSGTWGPR